MQSRYAIGTGFIAERRRAPSACRRRYVAASRRRNVALRHPPLHHFRGCPDAFIGGKSMPQPAQGIGSTGMSVIIDDDYIDMQSAR